MWYARPPLFVSFLAISLNLFYLYIFVPLFLSPAARRCAAMCVLCTGCAVCCMCSMSLCLLHCLLHVYGTAGVAYLLRCVLASRFLVSQAVSFSARGGVTL